MTPIIITVPGVPKPAGSKRGFAMKRKGMGWTDANGKFAGRVIITDANPKSRDWKETVKFAAIEVMAKANLPFNRPLLDGPLELCVTFRMPRIQGHFRTNGELKPGAPKYHTVKPDTTKLLRGLEDAITGIVWRDDARICRQSAEKIYDDQPGATITITPLDESVAQTKKEREAMLL